MVRGELLFWVGFILCVGVFWCSVFGSVFGLGVGMYVSVLVVLVFCRSCLRFFRCLRVVLRMALHSFCHRVRYCLFLFRVLFVSVVVVLSICLSSFAVFIWLLGFFSFPGGCW